MTRSTLTSTNRTEVSKDVVQIAEFLSIAFPGGTIRMTNASRDIVWGGNTWLANGALAEVEGMVEAADGKLRPLELVLSGVDTTLLARVLQDAYHLARVKIYKGFFNSDWALLADPHPIAPEMLMSNGDIEYRDKGAVLVVRAVSFTVFDNQDSAVLATPESQRRRYPGDAGQDKAASLMTAIFQWGGQYARAGGGGGGHGLGAPIGNMGGDGGTDNLKGRDNSSTA
jgi:hypothetical protein